MRYIQVKRSSGFKSKVESYSSIYKQSLRLNSPFKLPMLFQHNSFFLGIMMTSDCVSACTAYLDVCGILDFNNVIQKDKDTNVYCFTVQVKLALLSSVFWRI